MSAGFRHWAAFGTGVGIEIVSGSLRVAVVRLRPSGIDLLGAHTIEDFEQRPAAEWGAEYLRILRGHGASHVAATVIVPRSETTVRVVMLAGVSGKDTESALRFQIDSLHPYPEDDVAWTWARLAGTESVLAGICRQSSLDRMMERFAEAGVKAGSFTFSAALIYSALRLYGTPPGSGFLGLLETGEAVEVYGESPSRPVYSVRFHQSPQRAAALAEAELRLEGVTARPLEELIPSPRRTPAGAGLARTHLQAYLAALASACPRLALPANLLPAGRRESSSRLIYAPSLALAIVLLATLASLGAYARYEDRKYLRTLQAEIARIEPQSRRVAELDRLTEQTRARTALLDSFHTRTKADLEALREATRVVAAPAWVNTLELSRTAMVLAGESDQATGLLQGLDNSALFQNSEFLVPLSRVGNVEVFRIRSAREGAPK
jgi:hypothetical protein